MVKKTATLLFVLLILSINPVIGKIIEVAHFSEINRYLTPDTLVLLDIDDTLLLPAQTLGSDVWFLHHTKQLEAQGMPSRDAFEKALAQWEAVRLLTDVKLVEPETDAIVEQIQNSSITVMGLTTQGLSLATRTVHQLNSLNIDLTKTAPSREEHYFINGHGVLYRQGILFTSGTHKGNALLKFLHIIGYQPRHILFINDKRSHLEQLEHVLGDSDIGFTGLRYSYGDERVNNFDERLAETQWNLSSFSHLLSDEEALEALQTAASE